MKIEENEFAIPFFKENGFIRKRCKRCGSYYWTQDLDSEICGDAPCQEYTFIGKPPTKKSYSLKEMRQLFLSFFEKNGHNVIEPYPVVARWRDDVYFVGASIFDFQPYVTGGVMPPPANPLVVSQPCLRFNDLDNVGPTAGRHLVIFEMGGAHAFNYPEKKIYWKNETIRLHHELLTKELGVDSSSVTYKEHFWMGGGNAGPDVEACVDGLEISTLVFMSYKVIDGKLVEIPIKTVDTGYGMERWTWLSQGSVSGFHAVYKPVLRKIFKLTGLKPEEKLLAESAKLSGTMNVETLNEKVEARKIVANRVGMDWRELDDILTPIENVYAVADHTKALAFILSEGIVPSNTEEGYLARLLIRRVYRMLKLLGIEEKFLDVMDMQISYWGGDFPNLKRMRGEILEILATEEEKYKKTLGRGVEIVKRLALSLKAKNVKRLPASALIKLYDSHGLVPEIVKEVAEKEGVEVKVPGNFFGMVANKRSQAPAPSEDPLARELSQKISGLPETKPLYYENPYMKEFKAKVLGVYGGKYVVLDQTCFYPEGGGQPSDSGALTLGEVEVKVVEARKAGNVIIHVTEGAPLKPGDVVKGKIDWERRRSLMRHHTGTHILLGAARRVLGEHAWQAGAQKGVESSRLDISHHKRLTRREIAKIEELALAVIAEDLPVKVEWMPRGEAEKMYGFKLYQGGAVPGREIRVVKIGDWDVEACGGTHCSRTGEVGLLKILRVDRPQDGVERIIFATGPQALKRIQERETKLLKISESLGASIEKVDRAVEGLIQKFEETRKALERCVEKSARAEAKALLREAEEIRGVKLVALKTTLEDEREVLALLNEISKAEPRSVSVVALVKESARIFVSVGVEALKLGLNAAEIASKLAKPLGGGGGGKPYFGQGGGTKLDGVDEALSMAKTFLQEKLSG
ncbi:TPA: alanine--tRNA ligase [Candidatus Bathyarchaeota archaeon]|nr:alanine--tRNA ligase [Candidatus Bathyarchaeota archaeon]